MIWFLVGLVLSAWAAFSLFAYSRALAWYDGALRAHDRADRIQTLCARRVESYCQTRRYDGDPCGFCDPCRIAAGLRDLPPERPERRR